MTPRHQRRKVTVKNVGGWPGEKPRKPGITGAEVAAIAAKVERMTAAEFEEWVRYGPGYEDCKKLAGSCLSQSRRAPTRAGGARPRSKSAKRKRSG